jgi:hypothetical protein
MQAALWQAKFSVLTSKKAYQEERKHGTGTD